MPLLLSYTAIFWGRDAVLLASYVPHPSRIPFTVWLRSIEEPKRQVMIQITAELETTSLLARTTSSSAFATSAAVGSNIGSDSLLQGEQCTFLPEERLIIVDPESSILLQSLDPVKLELI